MAQAPKYRSVWQKMLLEEAEREKRARAAGAGNTPRQDDWQLPEPGAWAMVPVVGPAYEAAYDIQEGNYGSALFNGLTAAAELSPAAPAIRIAKIAKMMKRYKNGAASADAMRKRFRTLGITKDGQELHHTIRLDGASRTARGDYRNHHALLKPLDQEKHRRLTASWNGKPRYDPIRRIWHGTNAIQKAAPAALAGSTIDSEVELSQARRRRP